MTFADPITRTAMAPGTGHTQPDSKLFAIAVTRDPDLPPVVVDGAVVDVLRVYGLSPGEMKLVERWSAGRVLELVAARDPSLTTRLDRPLWTADDAIMEAVEAGSARKGSQCSALVVPGIRWERSLDGYVVRFDDRTDVAHVLEVVRARLSFQQNLLLHDFDEVPYGEVGLSFRPDASVGEMGDQRLVLELPADEPRLEPVRDGATMRAWRFPRKWVDGTRPADARGPP